MRGRMATTDEEVYKPLAMDPDERTDETGLMKDIPKEMPALQDDEPVTFMSTTWTFVSCFFMTVAGVLGVGILALPVKVARSGFAPFVVNFSLCLVMQWIICLYMIDLLQRGSVLLQIAEQNAETYRSATEADEAPANRHDNKQDDQYLSAGPDLHTLGRLFLNKYLRIFFDMTVLLHFLSVLTGYSLAGPTAIGQLIYTPATPYLISPWVISLTLVIVFGWKFIKPVVTSFTLIKGSLLIVLVSVVGGIGATINRESVSDWVYIGQPFLVGTVALGGAINVLPIIYSKIKPTEANIRIFRFAVMFAVFVCFLLNVLWTWFILEIVPQRTPPNTSEPSLEQSAKNGQISTYPLIEIINLHYPEFNWAATMVNIFITCSILVSFMTMGSALKHTLDGWIKSMRAGMDTPNTFPYHLVRAVERMTKHPLLAIQFTLYAVTFGIILIVAQSSPKSFLIISETFVSSALNIESGVFVVLMVITSNLRPNSTKVPVPLHRFFIIIFWLVSSYFLFAVLYNIATTIMKIFISYEDMPF